MPLVHIHQIAPDVRLGLWALTETAAGEVLGAHGQELQQRLLATGSPKRRLEVAATHALLWQMVGSREQLIGHDDAGKPLLSGWKIGISHTRGLVAVVLSESREVAVDVEYVSSRVDRVASHFLSSDEQAAAHTSLERLEYWCAKETAYKFFSSSHLASTEMRVRKADCSSQQFFVDNLKDGLSLPVSCIVAEGYVLAYAVAQES